MPFWQHGLHGHIQVPKLELIPESVRYSIKIDADLLKAHQAIIEDTLTNLSADDIFILSNHISFSTNTGAEAKRVLQFLQQLVDKNVN